MIVVTWSRWPPCPYMVKPVQKSSSPDRQVDFPKTWFLASGTPAHSNDDPGVTLTYFTARSNLVSYAFLWENGKTVDI